MSEDNGLTSTLRADAPAFNPSFNNTPTSNTNKAVGSSTVAQSHHKNQRDHKRNTTRNRRRQSNKNKSSQNKSNNASSLNDSSESQVPVTSVRGGKRQPTGHKKKNTPRFTRPDRKSRNHASKSASLNPQDPARSMEEHPTDVTSSFLQEDPFQHTLSLESSFPALLPDASIPSSSLPLSDIPVKNATLYASRLKAQSTVDEAVDKEAKERDQYFARMGLEKLAATSSSSSSQRKNSLRKWQPPTYPLHVSPVHTDLKSPSNPDVLTIKGVSNDGRLVEEVNLQNVSLGDHWTSVTTTHPRTSTVSTSTTMRRSKWDMDRLRDKWWDAISLRTTRNRFLVQLKLELQGRKLEEGDVSKDDRIEEDKDARLVGEASLVETSGSVASMQADLSDDSAQDTSTSFELDTESILQTTDSGALQVLLHQWLEVCEEEPAAYLEKLDSLVYRLVEFDKATLLAVVLDHLSFHRTKLQRFLSSDVMKQLTGTILPKSFFLAGKLGHSDCLSLFLTKGDYAPAVFTARQDNGDNILHHCCRGNGHAQALQWVLERSSDSSKSGQKQLSKLLLAKNSQGKTALHIACEKARVDLVETFLNSCSIALLSKMLATEDNDHQSPLLAAVAANASEVVMCLIMWRGSHNVLLRNTPQAPTKGVRDISNVGNHSGCPLVWASKHGNLDIILLLLQFSDHTGNEYQLSEALIALLCSDEGLEDSLVLEGCRVMISEGANPFSEMTLGGTTLKTGVSIACEYRSHVVVASLVRVGKDTLFTRQQERRKDPTLRKQPEAFFENLETKENFEMNRALSSALVDCLFVGWKNGNDINPDSSSQPLACAVQLFMAGNPLLPKDISRLHKSLHANQLIGERQTSDASMVVWILVTKYHLFAPNPQTSALKPAPLTRTLAQSSLAMVHHLPWFQEFLARSSGSINCPWVARAMEERGQQSDDTSTSVLGDMVVLIAEDGTEFPVHESVVAMKSQKLASAIQFERLKQDGGADRTSISISMDISALNCVRLLQHMYHGSIICGWSDNEDLAQNCQDLLELMMLGEEYLCDSLVQECEMRLLSGNPWFCSCWSCCKARRRSKRYIGNSKSTNNQAISVDEDATFQEAECLYFLADTSPIPMVTASNVLDILAVVQHLETVDLRYEICRVRGTYSLFQCLSAKEAWSAENLTNGKHYRATQLLKEACIQCILGSFVQVLESRSFVESTESEEGTNNDNSNDNTTLLSHQMLLLQLCLEDLSMQPLLQPLGDAKACQAATV